MDTMGCEQWAEEVVLYGEGELPPERAAAVRAHLEACSVCRREAAAWQALDRVLDRALKPAENAPPGFPGAVVHALRDLEPEWARRHVCARLGARRAWPLAVALAVAALLLPLRWEAVPWHRVQAWGGAAEGEVRAAAQETAALVAETPAALRTTYADWPGSIASEAAMLLDSLRSTWTEGSGGRGSALAAVLLLLLLAANGKLARDAVCRTAQAGR